MTSGWARYHSAPTSGGARRPYAAVMVTWLPRGRVADALVAVATAAFVIGMTVWSSMFGDGALNPLGWVLMVTASAVLYLRRRFPVAVAVCTLLACVFYYPLVGAGSPILLTFMIALFSAAAAGHLAVTVGIAVAAALATGIGELRSEQRHLDDIALFLLTGWVVAVIAMGAGVHTRKAYLRESERRAAEEARQRSTDERLRMARELHDVLGHNISLINVQASAALHRLGKTPSDDPTAVEALSAIKDTSKQALRELRGTLGVLRQVDEDAPLEPAASLSGLAALLDRARSTGLAVRDEVAGEPRPVPPEVDLAAYRIVQEALTNVTRHAGADTAVVRIGYRDEEVCVQVDDDGAGSTGSTGGTATGGSGIRGMRERARALGGELSAGARPGGGFRVLARLPLGERP